MGNNDASAKTWNTTPARNSIRFIAEILTGWTTTALTTNGLIEMFMNAAAFDQPVNHFITTNVTSLNNMFRSATAFQQDISAWASGGTSNLRALAIATSMFLSTTQSTTNYDALLIALGDDAVNLQSGVPLHMGVNTKYTGGGAAEAARTTLVNPAGLNWAITDGGTV